MKKLLLTVIAFVMMGSMSFAAPAKVCTAKDPCKVGWTANIEADMKEYTVYLGRSSGKYDLPSVTVAHPTTVVKIEVADGPLFIAVSASDLTGNESLLSNELEVLIDKTSPGSVTIWLEL